MFSLIRKKLRLLSHHVLYLRLLVLLGCIAMSVMLTMAGALFLIDYIPLTQSTIKKITNHTFLFRSAINMAERGHDALAKSIFNPREINFSLIEPQELVWISKQNNPALIDALSALHLAQRNLRIACETEQPFAKVIVEATEVVEAAEKLSTALEDDLEIKQSVIALLQFVAMILIMVCIAAITLGARRILVDRVGKLLSFLPGTVIQFTPDFKEDEFTLLERKLFAVMSKLESLTAGQNWADQVSDRLRRMLRAQEFLMHFVGIVTHEPLNELSLRRILLTLEKSLNVNNVAVIFEESSPRLAVGQVVYSTHAPTMLETAHADELAQYGMSNFMEMDADQVEVRCIALKFSSAIDSIDVLLVETERDRILENHEMQLLELTSKLLEMVIGYNDRDREGRRLALLEERAAIARELHDSLAQSLSFMKIQIARLQSSARKDDSEEVVVELRQGLDNAYRELRELLATFRVHLDVRGLGVALQFAIDEFSQRSNLSITLDSRLDNCRFNVNEEFHILHIVREALSNIVRHADAKNVMVSLVLYKSNSTVVITIDDDGIGYKPLADGQGHYGQTIMKERAYSLGGTIEISDRRRGGTRVRLVFTPKLPQG